MSAEELLTLARRWPLKTNQLFENENAALAQHKLQDDRFDRRDSSKSSDINHNVLEKPPVSSESPNK